MNGEEDIDDLKLPPKYPIIIVTCMDPRIDVHRIFQLEMGDVFILRNAGNSYSKDLLRSLLIAVYQYDIEIIIILGHYMCGMTKIKLNNIESYLSKEFISHLTQNRNKYNKLRKFFGTFTDEIKNVRAQVQLLRDFPDFPEKLRILGMFYDPLTGWIFDGSELEKFNDIYNFREHYKDYLSKKKISLIQYLEKNKQMQEKHASTPEALKSSITESESKRIEEKEPFSDVPSIQKTQDKVMNALNHLEKRLDSESLNFSKVKQTIEQDTQEIMNRLKINVPEVRIPKIYTPKIHFHVPSLFSKKESGHKSAKSTSK